MLYPRSIQRRYRMWGVHQAAPYSSSGQTRRRHPARVPSGSTWEAVSRKSAAGLAHEPLAHLAQPPPSWCMGGIVKCGKMACNDVWNKLESGP